MNRLLVLLVPRGMVAAWALTSRSLLTRDLFRSGSDWLSGVLFWEVPLSPGLSAYVVLVRLSMHHPHGDVNPF